MQTVTFAIPTPSKGFTYFCVHVFFFCCCCVLPLTPLCLNPHTLLSQHALFFPSLFPCKQEKKNPGPPSDIHKRGEHAHDKRGYKKRKTTTKQKQKAQQKQRRIPYNDGGDVFFFFFVTLHTRNANRLQPLTTSLSLYKQKRRSERKKSPPPLFPVNFLHNPMIISHCSRAVYC